jgi:hypothetical protein
MLKIHKYCSIVVMTTALISNVNAANDQNKGCLPGTINSLSKVSFPNSQESFVDVTEKIFIAKPASFVHKEFEKFPLNKLLSKTDDLSGVDYTYPIIGDQYQKAGDRRGVCLTDGFGAMEELLQNNINRFAYRVWTYTVPEASGISYADGEFLFVPVANGTQVIWNYKFALKQDEFPGYLGSFGRWLFTKSFSDSIWRNNMQQALENFKGTFKS